MKEIKYIRSFIGKDGQERKEYILVGYLFEKDGRQSILLKNYINPAALANEKGEVWLNVYEPKPKETKEKAEKLIYKGQSTVDALTDALLRSKDPAQEVQAMAEAVNNTSPSQEPKQDEEVPF